MPAYGPIDSQDLELSSRLVRECETKTASAVSPPVSFSRHYMKSVTAGTILGVGFFMGLVGLALLPAPGLLQGSAPALIGQFDNMGRYVMKDYDQQKPMASFLAGISGLWGIPMWSFYVNRGQGIASFGVESKDGAVMKFDPADRAYQLAAITGFRTFVKGSRPGQTFEHQPFFPQQPGHDQSCATQRVAAPTEAVLQAVKSGPCSSTISRDMFIGQNEMEIVETAPDQGLETKVLYYTLPNEDFPALVRKVTFTNLNKTSSVDLEVLDGLAKLQPYGVDENSLSLMSRTMEGWYHVYNFDEESKTAPYYHLVTSPKDSAEVEVIKRGHFTMAFSEQSGESLPFIVDPKLVFGTDSSLNSPVRFFGPQGADIATLLRKKQGISARTPCAISAVALRLAPGESKSFTMLVGHAYDVSDLTSKVLPLVSQSGFFHKKYKEAQDLTHFLTQKVETSSGSALFDGYIKQNFMDNFLRGGLPVLMGQPEAPKIFHTFSRIHGDLERDYNSFKFEPTYFSQGPGNFRDVSQNRRNDLLQEPLVYDFNVRTFLSFVQADGYNQLSVGTAWFSMTREQAAEIAAAVAAAPDVARMAALLEQPFRPGDLFIQVRVQGISLTMPREEALDKIAAVAVQSPAGDSLGYNGGFWTDHWSYTLDLLNNFLQVYPEKKRWLLLESDPIPFFMSSAAVLPRAAKYSLVEGKLRQYGAAPVCAQKEAEIRDLQASPGYVGQQGGMGGTWQRDAAGNTFKLPALSKLILLATTKFCLLDPEGMGVEMEAGKPGWNDAMNGLPGLVGSETPAAAELQQLLLFVAEAVSELQAAVVLPTELHTLLQAVDTQLQRSTTAFEYWDAVRGSLEVYREQTKVRFSGETETYSAEQLAPQLARMLQKSVAGLTKAATYSGSSGGVIPTYFYFEAAAIDEHSAIKVTQWETHVLPAFLEGPVRQMKTLTDPAAKQQTYLAVKASGLYDKPQSLYKISESLVGQPFEIGRMMAFNPGWLENESVWTHMSYKWYLELLRAGLYEHFFTEMQKGIVCFMDTKRYGRSPLEAASFIVSSAFPDSDMHGAGFLARLSGSTAEFLSIWNLIVAGPEPFSLRDGQLVMSLSPIVPSWLWKEDGTLTFTFLGSVPVTYHNPDRSSTWGAAAPKVVRTVLTPAGGGADVTVMGSVVGQPYASSVREKKFSAVHVYLQSP